MWRGHFIWMVLLLLKVSKISNYDQQINNNATIINQNIHNASSVINYAGMNKSLNESLRCINNVNETCADKKGHLLNDQSTLVFYFITIALTIIAYGFVLPPAYKKCQPSSVFIFSLAIADSFIGLVIVPIKISEVFGATWQKDIVFCRIVNSVTIFGIGVASTNVVVVSIDRVLYFSMPLKYRTNVTIKRAIVACCVAYILSLPTLFPAVGIGGLNTYKKLPFCAFKYSLSRTYMWFIGITYFLIPSFIVILLQLEIIRLTKSYYKQHREFLKNNPENQQRAQQMKLSVKREMRIQRMFLMIIAMFFVCWGPFVVGIICNLVAIHLITPFFIQLMRILLFINSFVNPMIMLFFSTKFSCCSRRTSKNLSTNNELTEQNTFSEIGTSFREMNNKGYESDSNTKF